MYRPQVSSIISVSSHIILPSSQMNPAFHYLEYPKVYKTMFLLQSILHQLETCAYKLPPTISLKIIHFSK